MIVTLPEGIKDSAELAQANGQAFGEKLSALLEEAPFRAVNDGRPASTS